MKKVILFTFFGIQSSFGQNPLNVGSLQISNDNVYRTTLNSGNVAKMDMGFDGAKGYIKFGAHTGGGQRDNIFYMRGSDGNIGIGTANPLAKLEVYNGNILVRNAANIDNESTIMIAHSIKYADRDTFGISLRTITQSSGTNAYGMQFFTQESYITGQTEKLRILGNGNVGIGVINPTNKLDVNGTIHSKEVKVDLLGWSDFVFKKNYKLPTLEEVENHIKEKGHLENIPSEEEVLKNGINLGEMDSKLLQKIEELTLYSINQNKKIEEQAKEIESLRALVSRIEKIENELARK
jgi:hypothetical protein